MHLRQVTSKFPNIEVHPEVWLKTRPVTSANAHLFMRAVKQCENDSTERSSTFDQLMWAFSRVLQKFPRHFPLGHPMRDSGDLGADIGAIEERIHSGAALAALAADYQDADKMRIEGSRVWCLMSAARSSTEMSGSA